MLSDDYKDKIKEMLTEGISHSTIAKELGSSTKTVQRVKKDGR
ncbi:hypothetical protein [Halodesulfovibrio spirochaetisodalis]